MTSTGSARAQALLTEAAQRIKLIEPRAFLVEPRVIRRVIKAEVNLPAMSVKVPHRKAWLVQRNTLIRHVEFDELGLEQNAELPEQAILLQRPSEAAVERIGLEGLLGYYWRLLFHARIDLAFTRLFGRGVLDHARVRQRIARLGQAEFDEVSEVLRHEGMLLEEATVPAIYAEFAAVYGELQAFAPHCLPAYFPSLQDPAHVQMLLAEDIDLTSLLEATRPSGAPDPVASEDRAAHDETDAELDHLTGRAAQPGLVASDPRTVRLEIARASRPSPRVVKRYGRRAARSEARGNSVAAALLSVVAARNADESESAQLLEDARRHLQRLVVRLQAALDFDDAAAARWFRSIVGLARHSGREFWSADKRLLHDLQKVCVDHERESSKVNVWRWVRSFGRVPIVRKLPNQREVLMSKHLATAARRLVASRLTGPERDDLGHLLGEAADSAEHQMRTRLRPLLAGTLKDVGFEPSTTPEAVAFDRVVEELLDQVVEGGFLTMGHLRDGVSSSHLKLDDVEGPREFFRGDLLLRADRKLPHTLDGVYRRADFYLRALQRATSLVFGNRPGRFNARFVLLPFGSAYMLFGAAMHVAEIFAEDGSERMYWLQTNTLEIVGGLGLVALLLIHVDAFRRELWGALMSVFRWIRRIVYDYPVRFFKLPVVRRVLRAWPIRTLRSVVLWPLVPTAFICWALPELIDAMPEQGPVNWAIVFAAMSVILNSRVGRDVEEIGQEWIYSAWQRIRVHVFVALFAAIMDTFKRLLEVFERLLYAVDEWLRFKTGDSAIALGFKAVLGVFWSAFTFVARFVVTLLVEPQINPIKHFPVVTLSHKLLLPFAPAMVDALMSFDGISREGATAIVGPTVFLAPGIVGFIAWELKSNWRLYTANRSENLQPLVVGHHGETFVRLMKTGFHSGTLPKLFRRLRRIDRRRLARQHSLARSRVLAKMSHVHEAVRRFVSRDLVSLLNHLSGWRPDVRTGRIRLASNSVRVELHCESAADDPLELLFEEQSGWLLASVVRPGWAARLDPTETAILLDAVSGFYRLAGVDLVREQLEKALGAGSWPHDVDEVGLVVWPDGRYESEATYDLHRRSSMRPSPRSVAKAHDLPTLNREDLVFSHTKIARDAWEARWASGGTEATPLLPAAARWALPRSAARPGERMSDRLGFGGPVRAVDGPAD